MSGRDLEPLTEDERARAIDAVRTTYARYAEVGRSDRWEAREAGARLATEERDQWLVEVLAGRHTIVDLGCGDGNLASSLFAAGHRPERYIGIDLLEERIAIARERVSWGTFFTASADRIPLEAAVADAVACVTTLSSVPPALMPSVAKEIRRILEPGGILVVYDIRYPSPGNRSVHPVNARVLGDLFPGWPVRVTTMTVLPPLARSVLAAGPRRYRALAAIPVLRSHVAAVLTKR